MSDEINGTGDQARVEVVVVPDLPERLRATANNGPGKGWPTVEREAKEAADRIKELEHMTLVKQVTIEDQANCITTLAAEMMRREGGDA